MLPHDNWPIEQEQPGSTVQTDGNRLNECASHVDEYAAGRSILAKNTYELWGKGGTAPALVMASDSQHTSEVPEKVFRSILKKSHSPHEAMRLLLERQYCTAEGPHYVGEPMFSIDFYPGECAKVVRAIFPAHITHDTRPRIQSVRR